MAKPFDKWNTLKKKLHKQSKGVYYHPREVWWCSLGVNIGSEQDGTGKRFDRPILIIKGFNKEAFFGVALIGKKKSGKYYYHLGQIEGRDASVVLSQARLIDTKRLIHKTETISKELFEKVIEVLKIALFE